MNNWTAGCSTDVCVWLQIMSQNFSAWKETLDELISRRSSVPSLSLDQRKISNIQRIKALCTLQTKEVSKGRAD